MMTPEGKALEDAEHKRLAPIRGERRARQISHEQLLKEAAGLETQGKTRSMLHDSTLANILVSPLFYEQPLVEVCTRCRILGDPGLYRWLVDNKMMVPVAFGGYQHYAKADLALLTSGPHISREAARVAAEHMLDLKHEDCWCGNCVRSGVKHAGRLPAAMKERAFHSASNILGLPWQVQQSYLDEISRACMRRSKESLARLQIETYNAHLLHQARAFDAVPQVFANSDSTQSDPTFLADAMRIAYNPEIEPIEYAKIIRDYRGSLSAVVRDSATNLPQAMEKVRKINEEVIYISQSRRAKMLTVGTSVTRKTVEATTEAIVGGTLGFLGGGLPGMAAGSAALPCLHKIARAGARRAVDAASKSAKMAAVVFGTSLPAVQVWRLRTELDKAAEPSP